MCREPTNGAEVVAARLEQVGRRQFVPPAFNPLARMKDTVVFGYLMASSKHGRVDVPDWWVTLLALHMSHFHDELPVCVCSVLCAHTVC